MFYLNFCCFKIGTIGFKPNCWACIQILIDDDNVETKELMELWFKVLETVVGKVDSKFVAENATKMIKDIPSLKNPFPKRKLGNRLIFAVAKNVGEEGIGDDT